MTPNPHKVGIVLSFHMEERRPIPLEEPGAPFIAWGLCLMALGAALSAFFAIWGM